MFFKNVLSRLVVLCGVICSLGFADLVSPTVTVINPARYATSVSTVAPVVFMVSDEVTGSGINIDSLTVTINNALAVKNGVAQTNYTVNRTVSTNGSWTVTLNHTAPFSYLTQEDISVYIADVSGNTRTYTYYFTTDDDGASPLITPIRPTNNALDIPTTSALVLRVTDNLTGVNMDTFSMTLNSTTSVIKNGVPQAGFTVTSTNIGGDWTITVNPAVNWAVYTNYTVATRVNDFSGALRTLTYVFKTAPTPSSDVVSPSITPVEPKSYTTSIPITSSISMLVTDNQSGVNYSTFTVTIDGKMAIINGVLQTADFSAVSATVAEGFIITINSLTDYAYNKSISVRTYVADVSGNNKSYNYSFTTIVTPDATRPTVVVYVPTDNSVNVSLNAPIVFKVTDNMGVDFDRLAVSLNGKYVIYNGQAQAGFTVTRSEFVTNSWMVTISPQVGYTYSTSYSAYIYAVDFSENVRTLTWDFSTMKAPTESVPPSILPISPKGGQVAIPTKSYIIFEVTDNSNVISYNSLTVTVGGVIAVAGGKAQAGFTLVTKNIGSGFFRVSLNSTVVPSYNTPISVVASVADYYGNIGTAAYIYTTAMKAPTLNAPDSTLVKLSPNTTNIGIFAVTGSAVAGTQIRVYSSLTPTRSIGQGTVTSTGSFTIKVYLDQPGTQSIYAQNYDQANGNYSDASKSFVVIAQPKKLPERAFVHPLRGKVSADVSIEVGSVGYEVNDVSFNASTVNVENNKYLTYVLPFSMGIIPSGSTQVTASAVFAQPVVITLNFSTALSGLDLSKIAVYYYSNGAWKKDGITLLYANSNYVVFSTTHFTDFSVVLEESGNYRSDKLDTYVAPNPVNLNNDPLCFVYNLGSRTKATVSVYVYDLSGTLLWKASEEVRSSTGTLVWDGQTTNGHKLSNGAYIAYVVMHDGSWKKVKKVNIAVLK